MKYKAFNEIQKKVNFITKFQEKCSLQFHDFKHGDQYCPILKNAYGVLTKEEVQEKYKTAFSKACYYTGISECIEELNLPMNESIPLVLFCSEEIARQCNNYVNSASKILYLDFKLLSQDLLHNISIERQFGDCSINVSDVHELYLNKIVKTPAFLLVLNKELCSYGLEILSANYVDAQKQKTNKVKNAAGVILVMKRPKHLSNQKTKQ